MKINLWEIKKEEKICIFDIDGVLNNYPQFWIDYVNLVTGSEFDDLNTMKNTLPYEKYRELKEQYRISGVKENLRANDQAAEVTARLKEQGYTIVIMSSRPADKYPTLYNQTVNWLKNNNIIYDYIIFGEKNKHAKILSELPQTKFIVEDNSYNANQISHWGYTVFLLNNKYNRDVLIDKNVYRIDNLLDIFNFIKLEVMKLDEEGLK